MSIAENYYRIADEVAEAAVKSGRKQEDVTVMAVTKFVEWERIEEALNAGATCAGESRAQELSKKLPQFAEHGTELHLIGQLQTNKVKYVIGKVKTIQSLDRLELAEEISRLAVREGVTQAALVEVNIGGEEQKGGIAKDKLGDFLSLISAMPGIEVKGLMCIPPAVEGEEVRRYFADMRRLFEDMRGLALPKVSMDILSMGMSGDYKAAVAEGSTMVRIGTALFGPRRYTADISAKA